MRYKAMNYANLALALLFGTLAAPTGAMAQYAKPVSPNALGAYYLQTLQHGVASNATGTISIVVWNGPSAETDTTCDRDTTFYRHTSPTDSVRIDSLLCRVSWQGYRVRRTIAGITPEPMGVYGQWKARDTVGPLCLQQQSPCNVSSYVFTGAGVFFRGFQNNLIRPVVGTDSTWVIDYPPGKPVDADPNARIFADPAVLAGFSTTYAVTSIDTIRTVNADYFESPYDTTVTITPATPPAPNMQFVAVVPNPYRSHAQWDPSPDQHRIHFIHLPAGSTVRIYTAAGDLVQTLKQDTNSSPGGTTGELVWNLQNGRGEEVVSGIYLYAVSPPDGRTPSRGHFVIIK
jgi:hypothetical protein